MELCIYVMGKVLQKSVIYIIRDQKRAKESIILYTNEKPKEEVSSSVTQLFPDNMRSSQSDPIMWSLVILSQIFVVSDNHWRHFEIMKFFVEMVGKSPRFHSSMTKIYF